MRPDASLVHCGCGFSRVVALEHAGRIVSCPDCATPLVVETYKRRELPRPTRQPGTPPESAAREERRGFHRYKIKHLSAYLGYLTGTAPVRNISVQGICLDTEKCNTEHAPGQLLRLDILFRANTVLEDVEAMVARRDFLSTGCVFRFRDASQEARLRSLVRDCLSLSFHDPKTRDIGHPRP